MQEKLARDSGFSRQIYGQYSLRAQSMLPGYLQRRGYYFHRSYFCRILASFDMLLYRYKTQILLQQTLTNHCSHRSKLPRERRIFYFKNEIISHRFTQYAAGRNFSQFFCGAVIFKTRIPTNGVFVTRIYTIFAAGGFLTDLTDFADFLAVGGAVVFGTRIFTRFIQRFTQYAAGRDFSQISQIF